MANRSASESGAGCWPKIDVGQGSVILTYSAPRESVAQLRKAVHQLALEHNAALSEDDPDKNVLGSVHSMALVEDVSGGARIVMLVDDPLQMRTLHEQLGKMLEYRTPGLAVNVSCAE